MKHLTDKEKRAWLEELIGRTVTILHEEQGPKGEPKPHREIECRIVDVGVKYLHIDSREIAAAGKDGGALTIDKIVGYKVDFFYEEIQQ